MFIIFTRLYNLRSNPRWYWDETYCVNMEYNFAKGDIRHGAIKYPFAIESSPRMPLYYFVSGYLMRIFHNKDILYPRFVSFLCAIGIVFPLFMIGKRLFDEKVALLGLIIFTIHKFPLIFNRWGVDYNGGMLFNVWTLYALVNYLKFKRVSSLIAAGIFSALFSLTSFYGLPVVIFVILFTLIYNRKALLLVAPVALLPFIAFSVWVSLKTQGEFLRDFINLFFAGVSIGEKKFFLEQITDFIRAFLLFPSYDLVYFLSIVGLFFLKGQQNIIPLFLLPLAIVIIRRQGLDTRTSYNSVMYLPILHLSMASLVFILWERIKNAINKWVENKKGQSGGAIYRTINTPPTPLKRGLLKVVLLIFLIPFIFSGVRDVKWVMTSIPTAFDGIGAIQNYEDTRTVVDLINLNTSIEKDVVISPELISWLIDCRTVNLYQTLLSLGYETLWHKKMPEWRWAYKIDYKNAKYFILDYTDRAFALQQKNMDKLLDLFREEDWKLVLQKGEYFVYLNPRFGTTGVLYTE